MIVVTITGPAASGKTVLTNQLRRMLTQQGTTWREKLAWWLLNPSPWNRIKVNAGDMHVVHHATPAAISNLRAGGVKIILIDGNVA